MKTKLFTLFLALIASVGTMFAEKVQIGDLYYNLDATNQTAEVTSSSDKYSGDIIIPSSVTYNSVTYSVTSIGGSAFNDCTSLTSVTIPNSVTSIGYYAFYNCSGLTKVNITDIAAWCNIQFDDTPLYYAKHLYMNDVEVTDLVIPNSVTSIGNYAFDGCSGLTSVTIGNSVTSIGSEAFYGCTNLTSVIWNAKNYADFASNNTPFYSDGYYYDSYWDELKFDLRSQITSFTFGYEVEHIPAYLCNGMSNLTSVTIPNSVTSIGERAFSSCSGLTSVIWNAKNCADFASNNTPFYDSRSQITSFTFGNEVEHIPAYLCYGMSNLTSITIPNSVTSIGEYTFRGCSGLTSVTIPNSVTSIGGCAFAACSGLTSIEIPNSVTSIGGSAFQGCSGLTSMEAPAGFYDIPEVEWPNYTKILNHVIVNGGELTENALLFINRSYKTLQTLDVSGVTNTEFADEAFKGYYNLQQLVLPAGLQKVGYMMVAGCKNLQSINIPASVEEIEQSAFEDCRSIKSITFGGSSAGTPGRFNAPAASASQLRRIGNWAFYNAHELQNLEIPEGVTEIGDGAFYGCTYLEEMVLPSSVQTIGDNTFALCAKLQKITVNSVTPPSIQAKTFFDVKRQIPVYVPDEAVSAYENDTYWQEFDIQGASQMPTGIDNVSSSLQGGDRGRLILHNGQIFILRGDKTYTLQGQEVK